MTQQIFIKPRGVGLTHMLACTAYGINLSDDLNKKGIECEIICDCLAWECFHQIFNVQHKNFLGKQLDAPTKLINARDLNINDINTATLPIEITADSTAHLRDRSTFFEVYKLTQPCLSKFTRVYKSFNNGEYAVIHVRGGDMLQNKYNNDYNSFLLINQERINKAIENIPSSLKVLLVSDDQEILVKNVDNKRVFSTSIALNLYKKNIIIPKNIAMHSANKSYAQGAVSKFDICFNAVLDLFLMAHSKEIYPDVKNSGYAQQGGFLFNMLQKNPHKRLL